VSAEQIFLSLDCQVYEDFRVVTIVPCQSGVWESPVKPVEFLYSVLPYTHAKARLAQLALSTLDIRCCNNFCRLTPFYIFSKEV
jgi:hypothetical protein